MEARAILKDVPTSPRKMRLVADMIRGQKVSKALALLKFQPRASSPILHKVLLSAVANWQQLNEGAKLEDADLIVKTVFIDGGRMLKRLRPAPQGRAHRIRKRSNHITIVIDDASVTAEAQEQAVITES
ncbi:50S ribosomal protein L22 [Dyadobacter sp. CECT 9623]|jgi:large subunit ribosomal protein L22|uniref:Large ribosomal subunit protein uL22 n=1 Tax=Dyadobacter linearis TaxID=2823330 RepID=A0ABN7RCW0_9BACT|nr:MULTISPECIES: 50S ribosomal protein L22 [unclassified Dyadobacter]MCE7061804.1 50S ribosomal protein L22 [Dyadobacter sp. CY343]CAG5070154.1 50S ribosomal protein L22 [Dyadobacter sp. CECT 9623]